MWFVCWKVWWVPLPNSPEHLILGTRGSPLALVQANAVAARLQQFQPTLAIKIQTIQTSGDRCKAGLLADQGGKGLFVKELEEALLAKKIDCAVHSLKDIPGFLPKGLALACFPKREDPRDCFISKKFRSLEDLPPGAVVGTSSPRRRAQLLAKRPDLVAKPLRGNIETRLKKIGDEYSAILLAVAGLRRLKLSLENYAVQNFDIDDFIPAIGQGILGIEIRAGEAALAAFLKNALNDPATEVAGLAERALLQEVGGDCYTPVAAHARLINNQLHLVAWIGSPDGRKNIRREKYGNVEAPALLGSKLAQELLAGGGKEILDAIAVNSSAGTN